MSKKSPPRVVPSFDDYYMGLAFLIASRSKDPSTQHGAIIVDNNNMPRGWGYNGTPRKVNDRDVNWRRPEKYPFIIHAEQNAFDHFSGEPYSLHNGTIYVTGMPCLECGKRIVSRGLKRIVYGAQGSVMVPKEVIAEVKELCKMAHISLDEYKGNLNWMRDRMVWLETNLSEMF